ncbi:MAG: hypothetical protein WCX30_00135 [Candidatus Paceibacterota bacterium]|jgi:hypothetical protein|nr:hypothetical protein [bacterium]
MKKILYCLSRILAILIIAFFAVFILEGFGPGFGWQDAVMHGLVALVIFGMTVIAWKWPKVGGWFFVILGSYYLVMSYGKEWWSGLIIGFIPLLTGILFLIEGLVFKKK